MSAAFEIIADSSRREHWLEMRKAGLGASDSPAVLGVSPFQSGLAVYADKIGVAEDKEETEAMKWGSLLEPLILAEFGAETGRTIYPAGKLLRSKSHPWMLATLDGEQETKGRPRGNVEAKATGWRAGDWSEGIPWHVQIQIQHQLFVTGREWGSAVALLNGCRLVWDDVQRDQKFIDEILLPASEDFWRHVEAREPVEPDGSASAKQALKWMYPESEPGSFVNLDAEFVELDDEFATLKLQTSENKKRLDLLQQRLEAAIGTNETAYLPNGVVYTFKSSSRKGYTVAPTSYRTLRRRAA